MSELQPGKEVVVTGPNVWGQYIRQGERGIISGFALGGISVRMNRDDAVINYPESSLRIWTEVYQYPRKGG